MPITRTTTDTPLRSRLRRHESKGRGQRPALLFCGTDLLRGCSWSIPFGKPQPFQSAKRQEVVGWCLQEPRACGGVGRMCKKLPWVDVEDICDRDDFQIGRKAPGKPELHFLMVYLEFGSDCCCVMRFARSQSRSRLRFRECCVPIGQVSDMIGVRKAGKQQRRLLRHATAQLANMLIRFDKKSNSGRNRSAVPKSAVSALKLGE